MSTVPSYKPEKLACSSYMTKIVQLKSAVKHLLLYAIKVTISNEVGKKVDVFIPHNSNRLAFQSPVRLSFTMFINKAQGQFLNINKMLNK